MQISPIQQTQYQTANPSFQRLGGVSFVEKIKIANYALKMKKQGYQLLRNPKGTSSSVIRVLKHKKTYDPQTLDVYETYERITKDFSQPQNTVRDNLVVNYFTTLVDTAKKQIKRVKTKEFYRFSGDTGHNLTGYERKGSFPERDRKVIKDNLSKKIYDKDVLDVSLKFRLHYPDALKLLPEGKVVTIKESLGEIEAEKIEQEFVNNSFWKNLFSNLFK